MSVSHGLRRVFLVTTVVAALVLISSAGPASAAKYAALVIDATSGRILYEENADARRYPASLTKMMTIYMVFEALERGAWSLNQPLPVSRAAAAQPPSKLGLRNGQTIRTEDAILALVTKSANDVSVVLAEALGGTESNFARMMTAKARQLGMSRTTFRNASGLPDNAQVTTARDMALLAMALIRDYPQYYTYFSTRSFAFGGTRHGNHNRLLGAYQGVDGIKTGYIRASGYNLVASARRGGRRVIGVVLGGETAAQRNRKMAGLLDVGFRRLDTSLADDMARPRVGLDTTSIAPTPSPSARPSLSSSLSRTSALAPTGSASTSAAWGIQVGAFPDAASARKAAQRAIKLAHSQIGDGVIDIESNGRRKTLYQARIGNVQRAEASRACSILKKKKFKCMVLKLEQPLTVAGVAAPAVFDKPLTKPQVLTDALLKISDQEPFSASEQASDSKRIDESRRVAEGDRRWGVQVGAYRSPEPALSMATTATAKAGTLLKSGTITVVPRSDHFYLARIHGLSRKEAEAACTRLRKKAVDCLIVQLVEETQAGWDVDALTADLQPVLAKPEVGGPGEDQEWGIQVGAFPAGAQARSTAKKAIRALPETLEPGVVQVVPVATETGGTIYRARIVGIDKSSAAKACRLLSLKQFACIVVRLDDSLASAD